MGIKFVVRCTALFLLGAALTVPAILAAPRSAAPQQSTEAKPQAAAIAAYAESAEGLKNLLQDWFAAIKAGDTAKTSQYLASFVIPNHQEWFAKTFGATEGARLEAKYMDLQAKPLDWLMKGTEREVKAKKFSVEVSVFDKSTNTIMPLLRAISSAMVQPTSIYQAVTRKGAKDKSPDFLGNFVYVDGRFRYIELQVMGALSTAPVLRVTVAGIVQAPKLIAGAQLPLYPKEAKEQKIQGTVVLHVIIGTEGTIKQAQAVSGHPVLIPAAIDAVKQWRYKPTLLNGQPVEVDTEITVVFSLAE